MNGLDGFLSGLSFANGLVSKTAECPVCQVQSRGTWEACSDVLSHENMTEPV